MSVDHFYSISAVILPQSECLDVSQSHNRPVTFPNLVPGQTYIAFTENGSSVLQKSHRFGEYTILSRNHSSQEAYMMVDDNAGILRLGYPGDEVCAFICDVRVCTCVWHM